MFLPNVNLLAVVVAAGINMAIGSAWYSPRLFGQHWQSLMGKTAAELEAMKKSAKNAYMASGIAALVTAYVLAHVINLALATTVMEGARTGFLIWLGFVATTALIPVAFEGRKRGLYLIFAGYQLVAFIAMGGLLAIWI